MADRIITFITTLIVCFSAESCYYDKADLIYPPAGPCDTQNIKYSVEVKSILDAQCTFCHGVSAGTTGGGINLSTYDGVAASAATGQLLNSILQNGKASAMPKGGNKLDDCSVKIISAWISNGSLNN